MAKCHHVMARTAGQRRLRRTHPRVSAAFLLPGPWVLAFLLATYLAPGSVLFAATYGRGTLTRKQESGTWAVP